MDKNRNTIPQKETEDMLKEKTNQDFNNQKPNPMDPNQSDIVTELIERYNNECNLVIASRYEIAIRNEKRQDLIDLRDTLNDQIV